MNEDRIQRAIEFLTQSAADSVARQAIIEENFKTMQKSFDVMQKNFDVMQKNFITIQEDFQASERRLARIEQNTDRLQQNTDKQKSMIDSLALLTRDLVTVAQLHSQRLDRLDGLA